MSSGFFPKILSKVTKGVLGVSFNRLGETAKRGSVRLTHNCFNLRPKNQFEMLLTQVADI